jgi:hypothetical protein
MSNWQKALIQIFVFTYIHRFAKYPSQLVREPGQKPIGFQGTTPPSFGTSSSQHPALYHGYISKAPKGYRKAETNHLLFRSFPKRKCGSYAWQSRAFPAPALPTVSDGSKGTNDQKLAWNCSPTPAGTGTPAQIRNLFPHHPEHGRVASMF